MIQQLALKHDIWVRMARGICRDAYIADDLVSEMYLKLHDLAERRNNTIFNDPYVYHTMKHIYINNFIRTKENFADLNENAAFIDNDEEPRKYTNLELPDCITWVEKQILLLRQEISGREIERQYHINFQKVHRIEKKAKEKLEQWARTFVPTPVAL
ncbi:sigma-70 family RNA polymerase sigma factor [Flavobacterium album]|nr:sigma-70 family RNA polymerase sigma factor [Flavobacterium album]